MGSSWTKAKRTLGMGLCVYVPTAADDDDGGSGGSRPDERAGSGSASGAVSPRTPSLGGSARTSDSPVLMPATPTPSSGCLRVFRSGSNALKGEFFLNSCEGVKE
ncbi:hypothetical protein MUK42_27550 [Musa troglodytarum]|uniref:Uncharacterized protein n=1 Tax=Musa troglodytarum TaxID=320322 RepID=A0A9E7JQ69_9LILI|nr:hypothetical protein MUK42_27550 [Musa troglodytarum]